MTRSATAKVHLVIDREKDPEARDDAGERVRDRDAQRGPLDQVEGLGILRDRVLDGFEHLVHAASVCGELAHRGLEGRLAPDGAQGRYAFPRPSSAAMA